MLFDYPSLLVAIGFSAICLAIILFASWITSRMDGFLLTSASASLMIVGSVFTYSYYVHNPSLTLVASAFTFLLTGMSILFGGARQFRLGTSPAPRILIAGLSLPIALFPILIGYDGIGFILVNLTTAVLLALAAWEYWLGRKEAPVAIASMCAIYLLVAFSFACCGLVLLVEGNWVLTAPPANWAENFNAVAVVAGVPGVGALSLALNQTRLARLHRRDAMTDPLTGLLNRRALFDAIATGPLEPDTAILVFDIDRFKAINDGHGHATGDRVIARFADVVRQRVQRGDLSARLGGEEFAVILRHATAESSIALADLIRTDFSETMRAEDGFSCTVSAGIAFGQPHGCHFEATLNAADEMLYKAKRDGRDVVAIAAARAVGDPPITQPSSRP